MVSLFSLSEFCRVREYPSPCSNSSDNAFFLFIWRLKLPPKQYCNVDPYSCRMYERGRAGALLGFVIFPVITY